MPYILFFDKTYHLFRKVKNRVWFTRPNKKAWYVWKEYLFSVCSVTWSKCSFRGILHTGHEMFSNTGHILIHVVRAQEGCLWEPAKCWTGRERLDELMVLRSLRPNMSEWMAMKRLHLFRSKPGKPAEESGQETGSGVFIRFSFCFFFCRIKEEESSIFGDRLIFMLSLA